MQQNTYKVSCQCLRIIDETTCSLIGNIKWLLGISVVAGRSVEYMYSNTGTPIHRNTYIHTHTYTLSHSTTPPPPPPPPSVTSSLLSHLCFPSWILSPPHLLYSPSLPSNPVLCPSITSSLFPLPSSQFPLPRIVSLITCSRPLHFSFTLTVSFYNLNDKAWRP